MAAPAYELWLTNDQGLRITTLDAALWWQASRQVNRIGHFQMGLPATFDETLLKPDNMVQLWRAPAGGRLSLWRVYFIRAWRLEHAGSRELITIWGPDCNDLLRRRLVAFYAGEAESNYTATEADDMMKDIVTNAMAASNPATAAGSRAWANLSVAADLTDGPALDKGCAWRPLLTSAGGGVLPDIAEAARQEGTEVFFDIVPSAVSATSIAFEFRTYTGQPGMDVSDRVVFSQEDRNLVDPFIQYDYGNEVNYIYAGGKGEEDERNVRQVSDATRYGMSQWNRCEGFADARNQNADASISDAGRSELEAGRPKVRGGGSPQDTEGTRFGLHWNHGDRVRMRYRRLEFDCLIRATVLRMGSNGYETIDARLEYES